MPLAHPQQVTISHNYSEPCAVVTFTTSKPGEDVADFQPRIASRGVWGAPGNGRHGLQLALTRSSAEELLDQLIPVVGRRRAAELIDTP